MRKAYSRVNMQIVEFETEDVITTSNGRDFLMDGYTDDIVTNPDYVTDGGSDDIFADPGYVVDGGGDIL